jgi:hypothetical protein
MSNVNEENTVLEFSVDQLAGVAQDLIDSFEKVCKSRTGDQVGRIFAQWSIV